ncbi:MAG: cell division protein ZapD [Pseudomonadota bacterium]
MPITYEFPLHERIRTWLRLEDLFDKVQYFISMDSPRAHHAALLSLFELAEVTARPELKSELIQELERQKSGLEGLRSNPAVDQARLDAVLAEIASNLSDLHGISGKVGQHLRENDWLAGIKSRSSLPGGVCGFDVPCYQHWLHQPWVERATDLNEWLAPTLPIRNAVTQVLRILRDSGHAARHVAAAGAFQLMLGGRTAHLVRVEVDDSVPCAPEISANKYAINIRFVQPEKSQKPKPCDQDVSFSLTLCNL